MEQFYTLQGEGFNTGKAAYFIRLAGCDVGCSWCDVKESWNVDNHPQISIDKIVEDALQHPAKTVVITGGEPCMFNLTLLTEKLKENNIIIWLETSGCYEIIGKFDWICVSPKKFKPPLERSMAIANELKIIVYNNDDFNWAEKNASFTHKDCKLYLQPEWSKTNISSDKIIDYIKKFPQWNISLQTHKYLNIP